jgi:phosphoglucosamine mutase
LSASDEDATEKKQGQRKILIGKDTRISGYMFESALEAGLTAAGLDILLVGPMPTPAIAYLTKTFRADAGIVISASHNPFYDNGIKFFSGEGKKLNDDLEHQIEAKLKSPMVVAESDMLGKTKHIGFTAQGRYIEFCKSTFNSAFLLEGLKIVLDCANGATYAVAPPVFEELGAEIIVISAEPNGTNINNECGSTHIENVASQVLKSKADLGIAFDGDGDRVIMVDHKGQVVDGDQLIYAIAKNAFDQGKLTGGVVGTLMSNLGLELALAEDNIPFKRANVGDRYVMQTLLEEGWEFGGEPSGHLLCLNKTSTGDGIIAALQVLSALVEQGKSLSEAISPVKMCPQITMNVKAAAPKDLATDERVAEAVQALESEMAGMGRVLLRPSGTEPLVRVMVEGQNESEVKAQCQKLFDLVSELAAS